MSEQDVESAAMGWLNEAGSCALSGHAHSDSALMIMFNRYNVICDHHLN